MLETLCIRAETARHHVADQGRHNHLGIARAVGCLSPNVRCDDDSLTSCEHKDMSHVAHE